MRKAVSGFRTPLLLVLALLLSLFPITPASADELSDARARLAALQIELAAADAGYAQAKLRAYEIGQQISAIDPATTDPTLIARLNELKTALGPAQTNQTAAMDRLVGIQQNIASLTVTIRMLETASQYGKNCPASWGVTNSDFNVGLESGRYSPSRKVLTQLSAEQRNIVVRAEIQFSIDGANWQLIRNYDYLQFLRWMQSQSMPTYTLFYSAYDLVKVANAKLRVVTTMAKEGCDTLVSTTDAVDLKTAIPPTNKMNLDLIYATYLPGITNYQERDGLKAVLAKIQTEFQKAFDSGLPYKLSDGYVGRSSLFIRSLTPNSCPGEINYVNAVVGQTCSIAVYWANENLWALVDNFSALAKENLVEKQRKDALAELDPIFNSIMQKYVELDRLSGQINTWQSQLNNQNYVEYDLKPDDISELQGILSRLTAIKSQFDLSNQVAAKYTTLDFPEDVRARAREIPIYTQQKYPVDAMISQIRTLVTRFYELTSGKSGESSAALKDAQAALATWKVGFEKEVQIIKGYINDLEGQKLVLNNREIYETEKKRQISTRQSHEFKENYFREQANNASKMAGGSKTSAEKSNWLKASESYLAAANIVDQLGSYLDYWAKAIESSFNRNSDSVVDDDGVEEDPIGAISVIRDNSGRFLIQVKTNQESSPILVRAAKAGQRTVTFRASTNGAGTVSIRTTRKLTGWRISLIFEDEVLARVTA